MATRVTASAWSIYNRQTGVITNLTENFDQWVDAFDWAPDSSRIYFTSGDHGRSRLSMKSVVSGPGRKIADGFRLAKGTPTQGFER